MDTQKTIRESSSGAPRARGACCRLGGVGSCQILLLQLSPETKTASQKYKYRPLLSALRPTCPDARRRERERERQREREAERERSRHVERERQREKEADIGRGRGGGGRGRTEKLAAHAEERIFFFTVEARQITSSACRGAPRRRRSPAARRACRMSPSPSSPSQPTSLRPTSARAISGRQGGRERCSCRRSRTP
jgi:hypothetical protein